MSAERSGFSSGRLVRFWARVTRVFRLIRYGADLTNYEPALQRQMKRLIKPGWHCSDVGAHRGWLTAVMAQLVGPSGHVVAFEPFPDNVKSLRQNVRRLGVADRVTVENVAVADGEASTLVLYAGRGESPAEYNIMGHDVGGTPTRACMQIPAVSLDDYYRDKQPPQFVKIDVEGAEAMVLRGMRDLLRRSKPALIIEFHDDEGWLGREELGAAGYSLYTLNDEIIPSDPRQLRVYHCYAVHPATEIAGQSPLRDQ